MMDRRIVFFFVFVTTLVSTFVVALVCLLTKQPWLESVLYTLATMWIMGVVSQLLLQNLYQAIVKPLEQAKQSAREERDSQLGINLEEVEEIDQVTRAVNGRSGVHAAEQAGGESRDEAVVGQHVEQKG